MMKLKNYKRKEKATNHVDLREKCIFSTVRKETSVHLGLNQL